MNLQHILANDELLGQIQEALKDTEEAQTLAGASTIESFRESFRPGMNRRLEAIVREHGRPVLYIQNGAIQLPEPPRKPILPIWRDELQKHKARLEEVIPAVGRIEVRGHPDFDWLGTGWLVDEDVVVTNRHVASEFGRKGDDGFVFRRNRLENNRQMSATLDTLEEHGLGNEKTYRVRDILFIEDDDDDRPDIAFLKVAKRSEEEGEALPQPIQLAASDASSKRLIGVVGYAARDAHRNPGEAMGRIFEDVYDVKRLHPGEVMEVKTGYFTHDCSTLGGNSGSVVLDFKSGDAVGLHFAGSFKIHNYALCASVVRERLASELKIQI